MRDFENVVDTARVVETSEGRMDKEIRLGSRAEEDGIADAISEVGRRLSEPVFLGVPILGEVCKMPLLRPGDELNVWGKVSEDVVIIAVDGRENT